MSTDRYEYAGLILTTITCAVCAVVVGAVVIRLILRVGRARAELPPDAGPGRRVATTAATWFGPAVLGVVLLLTLVSAAFEARKLANTPPPREANAPGWEEPTQSAEWRAWRQLVHEKLTAAPVTDRTLVDAVRLKLPALHTGHTEADLLRRDQAVADVLLSYKGVPDVLDTYLGIKKEFLGTGLSRPLGATPYGQSSVHEYLVDNQQDSHPHVWMWKITSFGRTFSTPIQTLVAGEKDRLPPDNVRKDGTVFEDDLKEILLRVKNKDHPLSPMIRFARFDQSRYKGTLGRPAFNGRPAAKKVFTSNLTEVWDLTIQQAAEKSGYWYKDGGDTLFVWIYVPYHSNEFALATWRNVLERLPEWLDSDQ